MQGISLICNCCLFLLWWSILLVSFLLCRLIHQGMIIAVVNVLGNIIINWFVANLVSSFRLWRWKDIQFLSKLLLLVWFTIGIAIKRFFIKKFFQIIQIIFVRIRLLYFLMRLCLFMFFILHFFDFFMPKQIEFFFLGFDCHLFRIKLWSSKGSILFLFCNCFTCTAKCLQLWVFSKKLYIQSLFLWISLFVIGGLWFWDRKWVIIDQLRFLIFISFWLRFHWQVI